jgi:hypothetical protein
MRILLSFVFTIAAFGQSASIIRVTPSTLGTPAVGEVRWQELFSNGQNYAGLKAPNSLASNIVLTLPSAFPATSGDCLTGTTAGVLSFGSCGGAGGGNWIASGFDSYHTDGAVIIRNTDGASTLATSINSSVTSVVVADAASFVNNKHIKIDSEVMLVTAINTGTDTLTVTRGVNFSTAASHTAGAEVGTAGSLQIEQTTGTYPYRLGNGMWYAGAVPYFRPVNAGSGILDVSSNGYADAWIDICGTDVETGISAFECLELRSNRSEDGGTTYGHLGMKAFGSGVTVRNLAINESGAYVTIGGSTFSNSLRVQAQASDAQGITIYGSSSPALTLTNGTVTGYLGIATASARYFPDSASGDLALRNNGYIGFTADAGTTTHLKIGAGAARFNAHITTGSASAFDIGDATNYFQTIYAENGDFTNGAVANQYLKARKLEIADIAGSSGFWDHRSQGSFVSNSSYTIRDNGGSRWLSASRAVSGSLTNSTTVFTDWVPALRSTGSGDAVTDSTLPALGATGARWSKAWVADLDFSGTVTGTLPWANVGLPTVSANRAFIGPDGSSGTASFRALVLADLPSITAAKISSGAATAGQVLQSDGSGNASWATPSTGGTVTSIATSSPISGGTITTTGTISCPTCFTTAGGTLSGSVASGSANTYQFGTGGTPFYGYFGQLSSVENLHVVNPGSSHGTYWSHVLNSASGYRIYSGSGSQIEMQFSAISSTASDVGFRGTLYPTSTSGSNGDLGFSGTPWRSLYLSSTATIGGAITANGGIATASGTNSTVYVGSGNFYIRTFSGADASCSGVTDGWIGYRTDTNELQVCNGGSVRKVAL